jgi:hypothetical protein
MDFHIVKMYKDKVSTKMSKIFFFINVLRKSVFDIYFTEFGAALKTVLPFQSIEYTIRVITKLSNSEQSYKGKVKTHKFINRQNQSTTGNL